MSFYSNMDSTGITLFNFVFSLSKLHSGHPYARAFLVGNCLPIYVQMYIILSLIPIEMKYIGANSM